MGLLKFIYARLRAQDRTTIKDTFWMLFGVVFVVLVFRTHEPTIPPFEQLKMEEGILQFSQRSGKIVSGAMPVLNGRDFGWNALWLGPDGFDDGPLAKKIITGKHVKAWMYNQRTHLWYSYRVVAHLEISGIVIKDYKETVRVAWLAHRFAYFFSFGMIFFMLMVIIGRYLWRYKKLYRQFKLANGGVDNVERGNQRS